MKIPKYPFFKLWFFAIIFTVAAAAGYAQVSNDELSQNLPPVVFINYEGPHARIDTREQIRQLGTVLGQQISSREGSLSPSLANMTADQRRQYSYLFEVGASNRYFIIHSISAPENGKLDADIFGLGVDAGVDHVRNLRTIIQGYLQEAHNYSESDARLLAEYITIYNAVYRGNWDYFVSRYKTPVMNYLTRDKAGLSIRYDEWPGRTLMLIPLGGSGLNTIDTSAIADSRVIEELRREDDQGITQRQDMVGLLDRQSEEAEQQAQTQRQAVTQEQQQIAQGREQTAQERQDIQQQRQATTEAQQAGTITPQEAQQTQQALDARQDAVDQKDQDLTNREAAVAQQADSAQQLENVADQKADQASQMRESIASDQQAAINNQQTTSGVLGVTIESQNPSRGKLVYLNPTDGTQLRTSSLNTVHVRTITSIGGKIIAVAGEDTGSTANTSNRAIRLIEINPTTLEMVKQGDDDIMPGSLIWVNGNDLYAVTVDLANKNSCFLGRFDTNLALQAKSVVQIHQDASVFIQQGRLLTQRDDGTPLLLNPADLTEIKGQ